MSLDTNSATLRILDLQNLGVATKRSLVRWFQPRPVAHVVSGSPKGILYPLPEVVARIRQRSQRGLSGDVLHRVVTLDAQVRSLRGDDDIYLGEHAQRRVSEFVCCLSPAESERARGAQRQVRESAILLPGVEYLRQITLIHPAVVRYVLSNQADELPCGDAGWRSWVSALWAVNPEKNT
ncbi:hypothetical protein DSM110277_01640 [Sulfitobacter pontiacus]|uniref:Uncharacterized protein n=1 Tax=Sulfitobacter pontiacus TaxID=60137 RepID=A0AAX3AAN2_9RHOB|nr:hypothetical protein [Sulfitobacter pontiacus]UOA23226.1 hypothetical protein DSM110277_01640 [Sulfitobacter pontiacus]